MPTILRVGPYRFFFYSSDWDEPPHVHVEHEEKVAKFWLDPVRLQSTGGFSRIKITRLHRIISEHKQQLLEAWNAYFRN